MGDRKRGAEEGVALRVRAVEGVEEVGVFEADGLLVEEGLEVLVVEGDLLLEASVVRLEDVDAPALPAIHSGVHQHALVRLRVLLISSRENVLAFFRVQRIRAVFCKQVESRARGFASVGLDVLRPRGDLLGSEGVQAAGVDLRERFSLVPIFSRGVHFDDDLVFGGGLTRQRSRVEGANGSGCVGSVAELRLLEDFRDFLRRPLEGVSSGGGLLGERLGCWLFEVDVLSTEGEPQGGVGRAWEELASRRALMD